MHPSRRFTPLPRTRAAQPADGTGAGGDNINSDGTHLDLPPSSTARDGAQLSAPLPSSEPDEPEDDENEKWIRRILETIPNWMASVLVERWKVGMTVVMFQRKGGGWY